jgi:hypothetical protein
VFELVALIDGRAALRRRLKPVHVDTALLRGLRFLAGDGLQAQHFLPRSEPKGRRLG